MFSLNSSQLVTIDLQDPPHTGYPSAVMRPKTYAIHSAQPFDSDGRPAPIASRAELLESLERFNISPETNSPEETILYGPGIQLDIFTEDPIRQMLLTEVDMDISGRVLVKLGQNFDWVFTDSETDRRFHLYKDPVGEDA